MDSRSEEQVINRGFYRGVKISVKTLDLLIVLGIAAIALLILFGIQNGGYTVTYNSLGGSVVESRKLEYGDPLDPQTIPSRQGYTFTGWYLDEACQIPLEADSTASADATLYAGWKPDETGSTE